MFADEAGTEIWSLIMLAERLDEVIVQCAASAEPANLAKYTFALARAFNLFYHRHRIIAEEDETKRAVLIAAANIARRRLTSALDAGDCGAGTDVGQAFLPVLVLRKLRTDKNVCPTVLLLKAESIKESHVNRYES